MACCIESLIEDTKAKVIDCKVLETISRVVYTMISTKEYEVRNRVSRAAAAILELDPEKIESMLYTIENYTSDRLYTQYLVIKEDPRFFNGREVPNYAITYCSAILVDRIPSYEEAERLKEYIIFVYEQYRKELESDARYKSLMELLSSINRKTSELEQEVADLVERCLQ